MSLVGEPAVNASHKPSKIEPKICSKPLVCREWSAGSHVAVWKISHHAKGIRTDCGITLTTVPEPAPPEPLGCADIRNS